MTTPMHPVEDDHISYIGYDHKGLYVKFHDDSVINYPDVSRTMYLMFIDSNNKFAFYNNNIKTFYKAITIKDIDTLDTLDTDENSLDYEDIKKRINEIGANLTSITIVKVEDYTHRPSDFDIASGIKEVINDLEDLYQTVIRK